MKKLTRLIKRVSIFNTLFLNYKMLPLKQAVKLPIIIGRNVHIDVNNNASIKILSESIRTGMITLFIGGSNDLYYYESHKNSLIIKNGQMIFKGSANISFHSSIFISSGILEFGNNFSSNAGCKFSCIDNIYFGDDVLIGGNCVFRDSDGHTMYYEGVARDKQKNIRIASNCWIANECHVLKGSDIPNGCVIAYMSLCNKSYNKPNCLIGGHPAKIIKEGINWEK